MNGAKLGRGRDACKAPLASALRVRGNWLEGAELLPTLHVVGLLITRVLRSSLRGEGNVLLGLG